MSADAGRLRPASAATPSASRLLAPLFGRSAELTLLRAAFEDAVAGSGSLVLVTGEAGIGKTRLVQELCAHASACGGRVLFARCWEEGGAPAYWPWIQLLRAVGTEFEALAQTPAERSLDPETLRFRLFEAGTSLLLDAARSEALLVAIDDLHAADAASLLFLRFFSEAIANHPILVIASYRDEDPGVGQHGELFAGLLRSAQRIRVRGLSPAEVAAYVAVAGEEASDAALAEHLHRITGGNPFFLGEVTRLLAQADYGLVGEQRGEALLVRMPEEVRALIRRRVGLLSSEATAMLRRAAVVGREFDLRLLEVTSKLHPARLLESLEEAVAAGLLLVDPLASQRYAFVHELVRRTLYDDLPTAERLELHRTIGRRLEELHRDDLDQYLTLIAHHLTASAPLGHAAEALDFALRAGDHAVDGLAYEEAALHYRRALELVAPGAGEERDARRRCEILLRLGDASWRAADTRSARWAFEEAAGLARRLGQAEMLARAALGYVTGLGGFLLFARFEVGDTAAGLLEEALRALPVDDSPLRARLLGRLAVELYSVNELVERRLRLSQEAVEMARRLGDSRALVTALHCRHWALATPDLVLERVSNSEEMEQVADTTGNLELAFLAHNARFHAALEQCDGGGVDRETAAMSPIAESLRQPIYGWHVTCLRAVRAMLDGRFAEAERLAEEALKVGSLRQSQYADYVFRYAQRVTIHWLQGRLDELDGVLRPHAALFPWVPRWRDALLAAELGDEWSARAEIERHAAGGFDGLPRDGLWILHVSALAESCALVQDERHAAELYELLAPYAERNAISYTLQPLGPVALRLGMLAGVLGRWEDADRQFTTALRCCERLGARALRARILYEHARVLARCATTEARRRARALAGKALESADKLDLSGPQVRIAALARELEADVEAPGENDDTIVLQREGDVWAVAYAGRAVRLRDVKGLRYIALLAGSPGRDLHALELVRAVEGAVSEGRGGGDPGLHGSWSGDTGPVLDRQAKLEYRRRLEELEGELEEARAWNDGERAARAREEMDFVTAELSAAIGLGGRDRDPGSAAEPARISVTKAIKTAIRMIERESPELAAHLDSSVQTGRFCRYAPPGQAPPRWQL